MIPEHRSAEADPHERGVGFGRAQQAAVENTVRSYERMFAELHDLSPADLDAIGARLSERLATEEPAALAEIGGIAAGSGVPVDRLVAINARTEIFAGSGLPECSAIGVAAARSGGEGVLLAQNWDWHPDAAGSLVLWTVTGPEGRWFTTLTEAGILGKIGLNSDGLAVCINLLLCSADGGPEVGFPIHLALRLLLERCHDLGSAERLLRNHEYSASTAINLAMAGAAGEGMRTFEVSPGGVEAVEEREGLLTHTNHFLAPLGAGTDLVPDDWPDTTARLDEVRCAFDTGGSVDSERLKATLRSHEAEPIGVCCHDPDNPRYPDQQETLASIVIHVRDRYLEVSQGPPCTAPYAELHPGSTS